MDSKTSVVLKPIGDVELWYAEGPDAVWRLPLFIEWKQDQATGLLYGLVMPALCFYNDQLLTVEASLKVHSLHGRRDRWLLSRNMVHAVLLKAPGIRPEFYYYWPTGSHPAIPSPHHAITLRPQENPPPRRSQQHRSFAEFIAKERGLPADVVLIVLTAIGQLGAKWLLERREAIDLGFVRLMALPLRANWKEIVTFKTRPWGLASILAKTGLEKLKMLAGMDFPAIVASTDNIALRSSAAGNRLDYTIEALPTDVFEKQVVKTESKRMETGNTDYVMSFEDSVAAWYHNILEAMAHYLRKSRLPWAKVHPSRVGGGLTFLPAGGATPRVRGIPLDELPAHIVPPDSTSTNSRTGDPRLIQAQADALQKVSHLLPASNDLRKPVLNGDVGEQGPEGANGLSLPLPSEESTP